VSSSASELRRGRGVEIQARAPGTILRNLNDTVAIVEAHTRIVLPVKPTEPLPLHHSWPLIGPGHHFDLGHLFDGDARGAIDPVRDEFMLRRHRIGRWACDLADERLTWSDEVHDLFGFPRGAIIPRADAVACYAEPSRAAMERLRRYAIRHRRGFTLDAEIITALGERRWMRLVAAPVFGDGRVVALSGLKWDVSGDYA
jgi:PAS domain-containing protein